MRVRARQRRQERVTQRLVHTDALRRVEHQHPTQQVDRVRRRVRETRLEWLSLTQHTQHHDRRTEVQLRHHVAGRLFLDALQRLTLNTHPHAHVAALRSQQADDQLQLVHRTLALQQRLASQQLREDAPQRPDVHLPVVRLLLTLLAMHYRVLTQELGGAVPTRYHVLRHHQRLTGHASR